MNIGLLRLSSSVFVLALVAALCQVLRNTVMKRLGDSLDEYINVWGRFTFRLPFAAAAAITPPAFAMNRRRSLMAFLYPATNWW